MKVRRLRRIFFARLSLDFAGILTDFKKARGKLAEKRQASGVPLIYG